MEERRLRSDFGLNFPIEHTGIFGACDDVFGLAA